MNPPQFISLLNHVGIRQYVGGQLIWNLLLLIFPIGEVPISIAAASPVVVNRVSRLPQIVTAVTFISSSIAALLNKVKSEDPFIDLNLGERIMIEKQRRMKQVKETEAVKLQQMQLNIENAKKLKLELEIRNAQVKHKNTILFEEIENNKKLKLEELEIRNARIKHRNTLLFKEIEDNKNHLIPWLGYLQKRKESYSTPDFAPTVPIITGSNLIQGNMERVSRSQSLLFINEVFGIVLVVVLILFRRTRALLSCETVKEKMSMKKRNTDFSLLVISDHEDKLNRDTLSAKNSIKKPYKDKFIQIVQETEKNISKKKKKKKRAEISAISTAYAPHNITTEPVTTTESEPYTPHNITTEPVTTTESEPYAPHNITTEPVTTTESEPYTPHNITTEPVTTTESEPYTPHNSAPPIASESLEVRTRGPSMIREIAALFENRISRQGVNTLASSHDDDRQQPHSAPGKLSRGRMLRYGGPSPASPYNAPKRTTISESAIP